MDEIARFTVRGEAMKMIVGAVGAFVFLAGASGAFAESRVWTSTADFDKGAHKNTNAVIAIDLKTGKEKWSFHATPNDIFNAGCGPNPKPEQLNCVRPPETVYRDVDFGATRAADAESRP